MADEPKKPEGPASENSPSSRREFFRRLLRRSSDAPRGVVPEGEKKPVIRWTRRRILQALTLLGAGGVAAIARKSIQRFPWRQWISDMITIDAVDEIVKREVDCLQMRYGIIIEFGMRAEYYRPEARKGEVIGQLSLREKKDSLQRLKDALAKYPPDYLRQAVTTVILAKYLELTYVYGKYQYREGEVSSLDQKIYVAVPYDGADSWQERFHHEFEHAADIIDDYSEHENVNDEEWVALNPAGEDTYGYMRYKQYLEKKKRPPGFVRPYGLTDSTEDQADIAYLLMTNPKKANVLAQQDEILVKKMAKVKGYMLRRSNGRMNEQYWKDLEAGIVDEEYWDKKGG